MMEVPFKMGKLTHFDKQTDWTFAKESWLFILKKVDNWWILQIRKYGYYETDCVTIVTDR